MPHDIDFSIWLASKTRSAHLTKVIAMPSVPRVGEYLKFRNAEHGDDFAWRVPQVTYRESGEIEVWTELLNDTDDRGHSVDTESEFDECFASHTREGWTCRRGIEPNPRVGAGGSRSQGGEHCVSARGSAARALGGRTVSLELVVLLRSESLPTHAAWQAAIDKLGFDVQLDAGLGLARDSGFSPTTVQGRASGFEIHVIDEGSMIRAFPALADRIGESKSGLCFRWGGDLAGCACVMAAAAGALAGGWGTTAYSPEDDMTYDVARLARNYHACLAQL